jgi:hypothetical protein
MHYFRYQDDFNRKEAEISSRLELYSRECSRLYQDAQGDPLKQMQIDQIKSSLSNASKLLKDKIAKNSYNQQNKRKFHISSEFYCSCLYNSFIIGSRKRCRKSFSNFMVLKNF